MTPQRTGPGRWCPVRNPAGVLWESATGVGFMPAPRVDGSTVEVRLGEGFDMLAAELGERVVVGDLDRWTPTRKGKAL